MTTHPSEAPFVGARLKLARNLSGLTLAELGSRVDVSHAAIHQFEVGDRSPSELLVAAFASTLGFSTTYFFRPIDGEFREEECHFRSKKMTAALRARILAQGTLFNELVRFLDKRVRLPKVSVPQAEAKGPVAAENAADGLRRRFGIGLDRPILNLVHLAERMGIVVTSFEATIDGSSGTKLDAFSYGGTRPILVLNADKGSTSRARFDVAHEIFHLVAHGGQEAGVDENERDADSFASALLLPRVGFLREYPQATRLNWSAVFALKDRWRASAAAILRRAYDLGRVDAVEYRKAWKHYMYRGWHRGEPGEPPEEQPGLVPRALNVLKSSRGLSEHEVAAELGWSFARFMRISGVVVPEALPVRTSSNVVPFRPARPRS